MLSRQNLMNFWDEDNVLFFENQQIANFVPRIIAHYVNAKDTVENHEYLLIRVIRNNAEDAMIRCAASELGELNFEKQLPGCMTVNGLGKSTKSLIAAYLRSQLAESTLPKNRYYEQTGWYEQNDGMNFLAGENFVNELQTGVEDQPPLYLLNPNVECLHLTEGMPCDANAVEHLIRALMRHPITHLPVWSYTLFASTRSILQSCGLQTACILYLIANQGFGKTTLVKNLCALYDSSDGKMMDVYDANSTDAALRDALTMARDCVVILDDICKSTNRTKQRTRRDVAASLIRAAANETPVIKKCGKKEQNMNCVASLAVTGEIPMEAASDITRCLIVELTEPLTDDLDELRSTAAAALKGYLTWLSQHYNQECSQLSKDYEEWRKTRTSKQLMRVQTSHFELKWLLYSFLRYAKEVVSIGTEAEKTIKCFTQKAFLTIWTKTEAMVRSVEQTKRPLPEIISQAILTHNIEGFKHNGCICIRLEELTKYFQNLYHRSDISKRDITTLLRDKKCYPPIKAEKLQKKSTVNVIYVFHGQSYKIL